MHTHTHTHAWYCTTTAPVCTSDVLHCPRLYCMRPALLHQLKLISFRYCVAIAVIAFCDCQTNNADVHNSGITKCTGKSLQGACSRDDFRQQVTAELDRTCAAWSAWAVALRWINLAAAICEGTKPSKTSFCPSICLHLDCQVRLLARYVQSHSVVFTLESSFGVT